MHEHQSATCAYLSAIPSPTQTTAMAENVDGNSPFPLNPAMSMPEDGLCLDQSMLHPSWPNRRQGTTPDEWSQAQQPTSANIKAHNSQTHGLGLYEERCAGVNDESCFWDPFVNLEGQSATLEPFVGESERPISSSAQECGVLYHLMDGGSDLLADHHSHVASSAPANRNDESAPGWRCDIDDEEYLVRGRHPPPPPPPTTTTTADATLPEAQYSPCHPGLARPGGEQAFTPSGDVTEFNRPPLSPATLTPDLSRPCHHQRPRAWVSNRPGDDNHGLLDAPANNGALLMAGTTLAGPTAEPHASRQRPYIKGMLPGVAVEPHSAASMPTPAMTETADARESAMNEDISYPSPPSECPGGSCSPVALSSVPTMSGQQASPTSPTSADVSKPKLAFKRDRDPPKNAAGEFFCDYEDCRDKRRTFRRPCEWNKHMDKHDRPYKCQDPECDKLAGFTYSGGLLRHQREVHKMHSPRQGLMCPISDCNRSLGKGFTRQENLKEHMRRVHGRDDGHAIASASDQAPDKAHRHRPSTPPAATPRSLKRRRPSDSSQVDNSDDDVHELREKVRRLRREKQEKDAHIDELEAIVKDLRRGVYAA